MLIRGGLITPMTGCAPFIGDILVQNDHITEIASHIEQPEASACILDARGLTIFPGLIDVHIREGFEPAESILCGADAAGVTGALLWPEAEGMCRYVSSGLAEATNVFVIVPSAYTDAQLHERFIALANEGFRIACKINCPQECRRVLQIVHSTRIKAILADLVDCVDMLEAIALSGCAAIIGTQNGSVEKMWRMARRLQLLGTDVAVTSGYPDAKLCHLPLCAALCVREGTERESVLRMITTAPAAISGRLKDGVLCTGAKADIAIYDGDPLLLATAHVMTISGGRIRQ